MSILLENVVKTAAPNAEAIDSDELCPVCSETDFYSLFTGQRHYDGRPDHEEPASATLGTLAEVLVNSRCPLCRLIKHGYEESCANKIWTSDGEEKPNPAEVRFQARAVRADYVEASYYVEQTTRDMVATVLRISLQRPDSARRLLNGQHWIQRHSPHSFDPMRLLLNGHLAASLESSLKLVRHWLGSCVKHHEPVCDPRRSLEITVGVDFKCIDTQHRTIIQASFGRDEYAALSYVWGNDQNSYIQLRDQLVSLNSTSTQLPPTLPRTIEDAIKVCQALQIPYLWVDLYCVEQADSVWKASEIAAMGQIFRNAKLVIVAGHGKGSDSGLFSTPGKQQRCETMQGRAYITAAPHLRDQILKSSWRTRAWTMQEGQLARRCAFFGDADISFLCGSGHWREALHSGTQGHEAILPGINTSSQGQTMLAASRWLRDRKWVFSGYNSLLMTYTGRNITYESDRLNAITGCLNIITEATEVGFVVGLPLRNFHYALLWSGEFDRPRAGFPSWSWVGWHCLQQLHDIYPSAGDSCCLLDTGVDVLTANRPRSCETEMSGLLISRTEREHIRNKCAQVFADISLARSSGAITIDSHSVHFSIDISPAHGPEEGRYFGDLPQIPPEFDSQNTTDFAWDLEQEYRTLYDRIILRDRSQNCRRSHYPYWYHHWPPFRLNFPHSLRGSSLQWLLAEGIEMIKIVEVELVEAPDALKPFHHVLCLGLDQRSSATRRFGSFCIPKEIWDEAGPKPSVVTLS